VVAFIPQADLFNHGKHGLLFLLNNSPCGINATTTLWRRVVDSKLCDLLVGDYITWLRCCEQFDQRLNVVTARKPTL
jgi:hypothetical protein